MIRKLPGVRSPVFQPVQQKIIPGSVMPKIPIFRGFGKQGPKKIMFL